MGRRGNQRQRPASPVATPFEFERTLADVEAEARDAPAVADDALETSDTTCPCGHNEFLLEAFMHVVDGRLKPVPVEVESLTCPECGREFEAVSLEDGRVVRGEFRGWADVDD